MNAMNKLMFVLKRKQFQGEFILSHKKTKNEMEHSFFKGLSGIGYGLLRIAYPDDLPSVLLFE